MNYCTVNEFATDVRTRAVAIAAAGFLWMWTGAFALTLVDFQIQEPAEGAIVNPGDAVTVVVYAYGSVAGIQSIRSQGTGDASETVTYGMFPPVTNVTEYFTYFVPTWATNNQTMTITVTLEDYVDGTFTKDRHVTVWVASTPTPTPTATPAYPSIDIDPSVKDAVVDPARNRLYLTNNANDRVDIVDLGARALDGSITVGDGPYGLDITSDTSRLFVCNQLASTLSVIDLDSSAIVDTVDMAPLAGFFGEQPRWIAAGLSYGMVACDDDTWGFLAKLDLDTHAVNVEIGGDVMTDYHLPLVKASGNDRYIFLAESNITTSNMELWDALNGSTVKTTQVPTYCSTIDVNYDGSFMAFSNTVLDHDLNTLGLASAGIHPTFMPLAWNVLAGLYYPDSYYYQYGVIDFFNVETWEVEKEIDGIDRQDLSQRYRMVADPRGDLLYVYGYGKLFFVKTGYLLSAKPEAWTCYE